jgi:hypothetical protein
MLEHFKDGSALPALALDQEVHYSFEATLIIAVGVLLDDNFALSFKYLVEHGLRQGKELFFLGASD